MTRHLAHVTVVALLLAACGAGDTADTTTTLPPPVTTTQATTTTAPTTTSAPAAATGSTQLASIRHALAQSADITSARMEGVIQIIGAMGGSVGLDLSMPFAGAFDAVSGNSMFSIDLSAMAAASGEEIPPEFADLFGHMEVRVVDGVSYIRFPFFALFLGSQTEWIRAPAEEGADLTREFVFGRPDDPTGVLSDLEEAEAEVTEVGRETVNGVQTTHYLVVFDTARLYAEASAEQRAELEDHGYIPDGMLPMELWISDDGLIVRYVMDVDGTTLATPADEGFERMIMTFDLLDINEPVTIVAPDPADVTDLEGLSGGFFGFPEG